MKILIFTGYFYPHVGGYEDHIFQFVENLSKNNIKMTILTTNIPKSKEYEKINENFDIYRIPAMDSLKKTYPIFVPNKKFFKIWKKLRKENWDIIMTRTRFFTTSFLGLVFSKLSKTPLIHVEHGSYHSVLNNKLVDILSRIYDHTIGTLIIKNSKLNIGISKSACNFLKHLGAKNPILIYRGLDIKNIKYKSRKEIKNLIYVGRLIYAKGVQDLIIAFSELNNSNLKLTLVGEGSYRIYLEDLVKKLNLQDKVFFVGEKTKKEVIEFLLKSDLFINPSYSEGLPTSVLEAGMVGLPVIATDVGGTKEVIIHEKTGLLIKEKDSNELKNAINFMIKNKKQRETYQKNLCKFVKNNFDWEEIIVKWKKLLKEIKN